MLNSKEITKVLNSYEGIQIKDCPPAPVPYS